MPWDTEETKRRLKQAATEEFAEHGPEGTSMEQIAKRAGINKERLYNYFGDKERLFAAVLSDELAKVAAAVPLASLQDEDIGEYAGRAYDYHTANPHLVRLLLWESLAYGDGEVPEEESRRSYYEKKVGAFASAQRDGAVVGEIGPAELVFFVIGLASWSAALPQLSRMITGSRGTARAERARRRAAVVEAARRLGLVRPSAGRGPDSRGKAARSVARDTAPRV
jgi:AcrR family transcriptional regulator